MLNLTPPRHTPTLPIRAVRFAQFAVIRGRESKQVNSTEQPGRFPPLASVKRVGKEAAA